VRIAYIAAGAGGMICGSCIHDNTLARALQELGHEVALIPTYTPLRTDEEDVSIDRVFFGAINVYLQQKSSWFRRAPRFLTRWMDRPGFLRWVTKGASSTNAKLLGEMTVAMLEGDEGPNASKVEELVCWLRDELVVLGVGAAVEGGGRGAGGGFGAGGGLVLGAA